MILHVYEWYIYIAAFGMGVDCVDVNNVVHYGLLNDVETYIQ